MGEFKPITFSEEFIQRYYEGPSNRFARYFTYLQRGFGLFNEAKNYILILLGTYWTIKTMDYWMKLRLSDVWLVIGLSIIALIGMALLLVIGRWDVQKVSKAREYMLTNESSITQYQGFNMQVRMVELLEQLNEKLDKLNEK